MPSAGARTAWPAADEMSTALWVPGSPVNGSERPPKPSVRMPRTGAIDGVQESSCDWATNLCSRTERSFSRRCERKLILSTSSRYGLLPSISSLCRTPPTPPWLVSSRVVIPAMMASLRVRSSTVLSCVRSDSTDLLNCSLALWRSLFSLRSLVSSWVWEREVKYWTEKNVDRQGEEVTKETRDM